jgi:AcrR family transcriptional regulator
MGQETQANTAAGCRRPGGRTARTRQRVLAAVATILVDDGYDALSIDAVAERAGVHRTTVYRRWRDTGGLLADTLNAARDQSWQPPDTGSLVGDLCAINHQVVAALTEQPPLTPALIAASFRSMAAAAALRAYWEDRYARAAIVVTQAVTRGEATPDAEPRSVLIAATAPLFHELVLIRGTAAADLADRYARLAAAAAAPQFARR